MFPALREIGTYSDSSYPQVQILAYFFHFRLFSPLFEAENRLCEGLGKNVYNRLFLRFCSSFLGPSKQCFSPFFGRFLPFSHSARVNRLFEQSV